MGRILCDFSEIVLVEVTEVSDTFGGVIGRDCLGTALGSSAAVGMTLFAFPKRGEKEGVEAGFLRLRALSFAFIVIGREAKSNRQSKKQKERKVRLEKRQKIAKTSIRKNKIKRKEIKKQLKCLTSAMQMVLLLWRFFFFYSDFPSCILKFGTLTHT